MVVSKRGVEKFLARPSRDSNKAKRFTLRALRVKIKRLDFHFYRKLRKYQCVCFLLGVARKSYIFFLDMGGGKTKVSLDLIRYFKEEGKSSLVLVPNVSNISQWVEEASLDAPNLLPVPITMSGTENRWDAMFVTFGDLIICTYQGFAQLVSKRVKLKDPKGKKKYKWKLDQTKVKKVADILKVLVMDECSWIKNQRSLYFRVCRALSKHVPHRFCLTGTPFDKDAQDLWAQFYVIDHGETLGETLGLFRGGYFNETEGFWGGFEYDLKDSMKVKLHRRLRHSSIRYEADDLPKFVGGIDSKDGWNLRPVLFPDENWAYYERLVNQLQRARGNRELIKDSYVRLRQLASGYYPYEDEDGQKHELLFDKNPKLEALIDLLREIPEDEQIVVGNIYHRSGQLVAERLKKEKIPFVRLYGKTRNKDKALKAFKSGTKRILLGSQAIAYGLNLQRNSRYMIMYESPDSVIPRRQLERRILRGGGKGRCVFWDVVVRGSVEMGILQALKEGKTLLDLLVDGKIPVKTLIQGG